MSRLPNSVDFMLNLTRCVPGPSYSPVSDPLEFPNYLGTAIFLGYIVAALFLTTKIVSSLRKSYASLPFSIRDQVLHSSALRLRCLLALTSFLLLSWNMSMFLIDSYQTYRESLFREERASTLNSLLGEIWAWMISTGLFEDFARELVGVKAGWGAVVGGLRGTVLGHAWMGSVGRKHKIPKLYLYALIGQILPVSFATSLFSIALVLQEASTFSAFSAFISDLNALYPPKQTAHKPSSNLSSTQSVLSHIFNPMTALLLYTFFLSFLPCFADAPAGTLLSLVLLTRLTLVWSYLPFVSTRFSLSTPTFINLVCFTAIELLVGEFFNGGRGPANGDFVETIDEAGLSGGLGRRGWAIKTLRKDFWVEFVVAIVAA